MMWTMLRRVAMGTLVWAVTTSAIGCGALDVSDPTAIEDEELQDAASAELLRGDALARFYSAVAYSAVRSGIAVDEFFVETPSWMTQGGYTNQDEVLDRRESVRYEQVANGYLGYGVLQEARTAATLAMMKFRVAGTPAHLGELFALRGFAVLRLAEDYCPGFPLHDLDGYKIVYGSPLSTEEAFDRALADFDSAIAYAADSARVLNLAQVGRARTLVGLGRFADAAVAAASVPTGYVLNAYYSSSSQNPLIIPNQYGQLLMSVGNREGGTGLDFVGASDPRLVTTIAGTSVDAVTTLYGTVKYPNGSTPVVVASGVEARLIEAEAALRANDGSWLAILNALRTRPGGPGLSDTTDPGTPDAQVDLLFRERAFWLFGTGHRLGDLRRLIAAYGRSSESVFPTGAYRMGGSYETATSIPFPAAYETPFNAAITGCTSR